MTWQTRWVEAATECARTFNNDLAFQSVSVSSSEYHGDTITYEPIAEYVETRFVSAIEVLGVGVVDSVLGPSAAGTYGFDDETRALGFLIGLRETGPALLPGRTPSDSEHFTRVGGVVYIRNFSGSGLDYVARPAVRNGILDAVPGFRASASSHHYDRSVVLDDPSSSDPDDVLLRQSDLLTIFDAYVQYQSDQFLRDILSAVTARSVRLFWRALTFGGQNGTTWQASRAGHIGRNTVRTLLEDLGLPWADVPSLWSTSALLTQIELIPDSERTRLARLARLETSHGDLSRIRARIAPQIAEGLTNARYFQAIKMASVAQGLLDCYAEGQFEL